MSGLQNVGFTKVQSEKVELELGCTLSSDKDFEIVLVKNETT